MTRKEVIKKLKLVYKHLGRAARVEFDTNSGRAFDLAREHVDKLIEGLLEDEEAMGLPGSKSLKQVLVDGVTGPCSKTPACSIQGSHTIIVSCTDLARLQAAVD